MSRSVRVVKALTYGYGYQFAVMVVGLLLTPFLIRRLGTQIYGEWLVVSQVLGVLALLDLGVTALLGRDVAAASGRADAIQALPETLQRARWLVWLQTPLVAVTGVITWLIMTDSRPELSFPLGLILFVILALFPARIYVVVITGLQDFGFGAAVQAVCWSLTTALTIGLVLAGCGLEALAIGWVVGQIISPVACYLRIRTRFPGILIRNGHPSWSEIKSQFVASLWLSIYQVAAVLTLGSDLILLGWVLGTEAVVIYSCTGKLSGIGLHMLGSVVTSSFPALSQLHAEGDPRRYWQAAQAVGAALLLLSGGVTVVLAAANPAFVVAWVGSDQFAGPMTSLLCALVMLIRHFGLTMTGPAYTLRREQRLAVMVVVEGLVTVAATVAWTSYLGIIGVPLGILTSLGLVTLPVSVRLIATAASTTSRNVLGWHTPWALRFVAVFVPVGVLASGVPVTEMRTAVVITIASVVLYTIVMLPLLNREPLAAYRPSFLTPIRRLIGYGVRTSTESQAGFAAKQTQE